MNRNSTNLKHIIMKKTSIVFIVLATTTGLLSSCTQANKTDVTAKIAEVERKYQDSINVLQQELIEANKKIEILSYPADQRLQKAKDYLESGELNKAKNEILQLREIFPNSSEASSSLLE